jgi:hypothetical protein
MSAQRLDLSEWERRDAAVREAGVALLRRVEGKIPELQPLVTAAPALLIDFAQALDDLLVQLGA